MNAKKEHTHSCSGVPEASSIFHPLLRMLGAVPVFLAIGIGSGLVGAVFGLYLVVTTNLPEVPDLSNHRFKTVSTLYADNGELIGVYYNEKRFAVPLKSLPPHVPNAFVAAEDARFYQHNGIDYVGIFRALAKDLQTRSFAQGGSTITQQLTRSILLSKEKKLSRKIREMVLARALERTNSKEKILETYLNDVYLGRSAYGIEAGANAYFGKSAKDLTIVEAALLAGAVTNPVKYSAPNAKTELLKRRKYVLSAMLKNHFISKAEYKTASDQIPDFKSLVPNIEKAPHFTDAVKKYVVAKYGEKALMNDGLRIWTTLDLQLQRKAEAALISGARSWEARQQRPAGLVRIMKPGEVKDFLRAAPQTLKEGDTAQAVIRKVKQLKNADHSPYKLYDCAVALLGNRQFKVTLASRVPYQSNDVVEFRVIKQQGKSIVLKHQDLPTIQGALVTIENNTGFIKAMVGGLNYEKSTFNRVTQAVRQPGSAFKPIIYSAAMEWAHYGPFTTIVDEPIAIKIENQNEEWMPENADGRYKGRVSLRSALAESRNVVAVKLLMDIGPDLGVKMARKMGIKSPLGDTLSLALGSYELSPLELTSAYSVFPNMGVRVKPVLVKKIVDGKGKVLEDNSDRLDTFEITRNDSEQCHKPVEPAHGKNDFKKGSERHPELIRGRLFTDPEVACDVLTPDIGPRMTRAMSPQTAYIVSTMLRDVGMYGTAHEISKLKRQDLAGKTGTTDEFTDAWFVGFNPKYTTGVWMGYDTRISLGDKEFGGAVAVPVWVNFMTDLLKNQPNGVYPVPSGLVLNVDRRKVKDPVKLFWSAQPDFPPGTLVKRESPLDSTQPKITTVGLNDPRVETQPNRTVQQKSAPKVTTVAAVPQRPVGNVGP